MRVGWLAVAALAALPACTPAAGYYGYGYNYPYGAGAYAPGVAVVPPAVNYDYAAPGYPVAPVPPVAVVPGFGIGIGPGGPREERFERGGPGRPPGDEFRPERFGGGRPPGGFQPGRFVGNPGGGPGRPMGGAPPRASNPVRVIGQRPPSPPPGQRPGPHPPGQP